MQLEEHNRERLALAALCVSDGIWDWQIDKQTFFASTAWLQMLGRIDEPPPVHPDEWFALVHPKDRVRLRIDLEAALASSDAHFEHEHRVRHGNGGYRWVAIRAVIVRSPDGVAVRMVGILSDISDRKQLDALVRADSLYDPLTLLPGRRLFDRRLQRALERARRHAEYSFAVLFIDLDRFKQVNDLRGHRIGDLVLAEVGRRLKACLRPGDMVARRGGDEFTVLVDDLEDLTDALGVAERIQIQIAAPMDVDGVRVMLSASIGIAASNRRYSSSDDILHDADRSMYQAKLRAGHCRQAEGASVHALAAENQLFMTVETLRAPQGTRPR